MAKEYWYLGQQFMWKGKDVQHKGKVFLSDVYLLEDGDDGPVGVQQQAQIDKGRIPVEKFDPETWNYSLGNKKGVVRQLIADGLIEVREEGASVSKVKAPKAEVTKGKPPVKKVVKKVPVKRDRVEAVDVSENAEPVHVEELDKEDMVDSGFSGMSYIEKQAFIQGCKKASELEEILANEELGDHIKRLIEKKIKGLKKK